MNTARKIMLYVTIALSLVTYYFCNRITDIFNRAEGTMTEKYSFLRENLLPLIREKPVYIATDKESVIGGVMGLLVIWAIFMYNYSFHFNTMPGKEHGSAKWSKKGALKKKEAKNFDDNMILTQTEFMSYDNRKTRRNANVLVNGGSGTGKTFYFVKPNELQFHCSYVVVDPKGTNLPETGKAFYEEGYDIKVFNTVNFSKSMHYNPFAYIRSEKDILKLANTIIINTEEEGEKPKGDMWLKAERLMYQAMIGYVHYECVEEERNFDSLLMLLNNITVKESNEDFVSPVDILFEELEQRDPDHFAVRQYKKFKKAAGKTAKSILISCAARLSPFDIKEIREITSYDEMQLDTLGDKKTIVYLIIDDMDPTFNFLVAILETQVFDVLKYKADNIYNGKLPVHVRFLLDELANIGKIPYFQKLIASVRSREMSICPIIQNVAQLEEVYGEKAAKTIIGNCDTFLFLGSSETDTTKEVSERAGKSTVDMRNINVQKGSTGSYTENWTSVGRELLTAAEASLLEDDECILFVRGFHPFKSKKYDVTKHKRFKQLADYDEKNYFDIEILKTKDLTVSKFFTNVSQIYEPEETLEELNELVGS